MLALKHLKLEIDTCVSRLKITYFLITLNYSISNLCDGLVHGSYLSQGVAMPSILSFVNILSIASKHGNQLIKITFISFNLLFKTKIWLTSSLKTLSLMLDDFTPKITYPLLILNAIQIWVEFACTQRGRERDPLIQNIKTLKWYAFHMLIFFRQIDTKINLKNPKLVYSKSSEMNRQQIYTWTKFWCWMD